MKYLKLYSSQSAAIGQIIDTPNVAMLATHERVLFIPETYGETVHIVEDEDFIKPESETFAFTFDKTPLDSVYKLIS